MAIRALNMANKNSEIVYSSPHLDGQYRKDVNNNIMKELLPDFQFTDLEVGMKKTYDKIS